MDLNQFLQWQQAGKRRSIKIELGNATQRDYVKVWAYDYDTATGQSVTSVDEIDLVAVRKRELKARLAELEKLEVAE